MVFNIRIRGGWVEGLTSYAIEYDAYYQTLTQTFRCIYVERVSFFFFFFV